MKISRRIPFALLILSTAVAIGQGEVQRLLPRSEGRQETNLRIPFEQSLTAGHHYRVRYQMRAVADEGATVGQAGAEVTIGALPAEGKVEREMIEFQTVSVVGENWESFALDWVAQRNYAAGELRIQFRPSYFREVIELRGIELVAYGATPPVEKAHTGYSYPGQEPEAAWRAQADARIREHRMAPVTIRVIDEWGNPVEGARVHIEMQRHEYLFGTCVKASRITDAPIVVNDPEFDHEQYLADNEIYRDKLRELFNFAVFENDMKWPNWAGRRSDRGWSQEVTMNAVGWLNENNFAVKSHTMLWGSWQNTPAYLKEKEDDPAALRNAIFNHLADQGAAFRDHIEYADVLNEAMSHNNLIELVGWDQVGEWFKAAKVAMPEVKLVINEFDILGNGGSVKRQDSHHALVERLIADGAPVDVLGFQSHFWSTRLTPPERLYAIIDRFAGFGLPLMVSEFDMNILDERLQADYTRDFLKLWFSHPATESFIMWGFWGKAHWFGEPGALFRADWSPKPNLRAYTGLVFGEWWSDEIITTDVQGKAATRVFKGEYNLTVSAPGHHTATRRPRVAAKGLEMLVVLYPAQ
ncbi:MAG: endo-1,4-beta-xylanase [Oceanipulchritudo sp.]